MLSALCDRIRRHLHAASVAFVATAGGAPVCLASAGGRPNLAIAVRAAAAGVAIAPHRGGAEAAGSWVDAAAPVLYGGSNIAALAVRWTIGTPHDLSAAPAVLAMTSVASAPIVCGALARQAAATVPALEGLRARRPRWAHLRRSVERAAAAPFAVLVPGRVEVGRNWSRGRSIGGVPGEAGRSAS